MKKAGHQNNQNNMQSAAGKKSSNIPTIQFTHINKSILYV